MHVARVIAIVAHADDADLCLLEIFIGESNTVEHCLCGGLCWVLCECLAVLVQFHFLLVVCVMLIAFYTVAN